MVLILVILVSLTVDVNQAEEKWVPYQPDPKQVTVRVNEVDGKIFVETSITFKNAGFYVDWNSVAQNDSSFYVYVKVKAWTGPSAQVITQKTHVYNLGSLPPGSYSFVFNVNGNPVKTVKFKVEPSWFEISSYLPFLILVMLILIVFIFIVFVRIKRQHESLRS